MKTALELDKPDLGEGFRGEVITAGHPIYDQARQVWNGAIDRRPLAIARCTGPADVVAAIRHAQERGLLVSIRGGGHGVAGPAIAEGGLVIDCSPMKGIHVDPARRVVRVQAGVLLGELDRETQLHGLAVPSGIVTHTGVAGLTLGGGLGWLMRAYGLTIDHLLSCDLVTADGRLLRASTEENPDLFWGLRGAGGNFGVVTSFEFRAQPVVPPLLAGSVFWALEDAPEVLRFYREWVATVPNELTTIAFLRRALPLASIPTELHGRQVLIIGTCYAGDREEGERVLEPLRNFGSPLLDLVGPKSFLTHQAHIDAGVVPGWHYHWKSYDLPPLSVDLIDAIVSNATKQTSLKSSTLLFQLGGAVASVDEDATAYSHRKAAHAINVVGCWLPDDPVPDRHIAWARNFGRALEPYQIGAYVNFLGDEGEDRVRDAYGARKYRRLVELKSRYDPDNFFRLNQNIKPRSGGPLPTDRSATKGR